MSQPIGSVHVEVVPTAKGFVDDISKFYEKEAEKLGKKVGDKLSKPIADGITKGVDEGLNKADAKGQAAKKGKETGGAFSKALKAELKAALSDLPDIEPHLDSLDLFTDIAAVKAELESLTGTEIDLDLNGEAALAKVAEVRAQIEALATDEVDIGVQFDLHSAAERLAQFEKKIADSLGKSSGSFARTFRQNLEAALSNLPKVTVPTSLGDLDLQKIRSDIAGLSSKRIGVDIDAADALAKIATIRAALVALAASTTDIRLKLDIEDALNELDVLPNRIKESFKKNEGEFARDFKAAVAGAVESIPEVHLKFESDDLNRKLAELRASLAGFSDLNIGVDITDTGALAHLTALRAELEALKKGATFQVEADINSALDSIDGLLGRIHDAALEGSGDFARTFSDKVADIGKNLPDIELHANSDAVDAVIADVKTRLATLADKRIGIDIDEGDALAELAALEAALRALPNDLSIRIRADVIKTVDGIKSLREESAGLPGDFDSIGSAIDSMAEDGVGASKKLLSGMSRVKLILGAVVALFPFIAGAIVALSGAIALLAVPILAVVAGMEGLKAVAGELAVPFKSLQAVVSATFVQGLQPAVAGIISLMPTLTAGLSSTAAALSNVANQIVATVTSSAGLANLEGIFGGVTRVIEGLGPSLSSLTANMLRLANEGLKGFESLGPVMTHVGDIWSETIARMSDNGTLVGSVQGLVDIFGSLLELLAPLTELGAALLTAFGGPLADAIRVVAFALEGLAAILPPVIEGLSSLSANVDLFGTRGQKPTTSQLLDGLRDLVGLSTEAKTSVGELGTATEGAQAKFDALAAAQAKAVTAQEAYTQAVAAHGAGSKEAQSALLALADATSAVQQAQAAAAGAVSGLNAELNAQVTALQGVIGSTLGYEAALATLATSTETANKAIKAHGVSSKEAESAIRGNAAALEQAAIAAGAQAKAIATAKGALDPAAAGTRGYTLALLANASAASGPARQHLLSLAETYGQAALSAADADAKASGLATTIITLPSGKTITVLLDPTKIPEALQSISGQIAGTTATINTDANTSGITNGVNGAVAAANSKTATIGTAADGFGFNSDVAVLAAQTPSVIATIGTGAESTGATADITQIASQAGAVTAQLSSKVDPAGANAAIQGIASGAGSTTATVNTDANIAGANGKIDQVVAGAAGKTAIMPVDGNPALANQKITDVVTKAAGTTGMMKIDANIDQALAKIKAVESAAAASHPSITVTVNEVRGTTVPRGNRYGAVYGLAKGDLIEKFARGGTLTPMSNRWAKIVPPNTWRVIGDRPSGAEAFIPLDKSPRSLAILATAARAMGRAIIPLATGGTVVSTQQAGAFQTALAGATQGTRAGGDKVSSSPLIGTVYLTTPQGADPTDYVDELSFALRHYRHEGLHV